MREIKCRYADQYKGKQPPKCQCDVCYLKWELAELHRLLDKKVENLTYRIDRTLEFDMDDYY